MHADKRFSVRFQVCSIAVTLLGVAVLGFTSCGFRHQPNRSESYVADGYPKPNMPYQEVAYCTPQVPVPTIPDAEYVNDDELCLTCHKTYTETFAHNVHRGIAGESKCESCHGPASRHLETRGLEPGLILSFKSMSPAERSESCIQCHEQNNCSPGAQWRTSKHACAGLSCTDCHNAHYNVAPGTPAVNEPEIAQGGEQYPAALVSFLQDDGLPSLAGSSNSLNAVAPQLCYGCHGDKVSMSQIAGPHQVGGVNGFNCTTCHDSHGGLVEASREELCLQCHQTDSPTMAWHRSTHNLVGVACTDCHNPHPDSAVQRFVNIRHTNVERPKRMPMSVQEPQVCFKCHPGMYAKSRLPSHHPIREGKMVCSDCHNAHGAAHQGLNEASVNMVCYRCHAEKQGPFVWTHPPVQEDCGICHEPHGTVTNNLLRQPPTFLCLRCHAGHRKDNRNPDPTWVNEAGPTPNRANPSGIVMRSGEYTDCSQCHAQIHGSNIPSNTGRNTFLR